MTAVTSGVTAMDKARFMQVINVMHRVRTNEQYEFIWKYGGQRGYRPYRDFAHAKVIVLL